MEAYCLFIKAAQLLIFIIIFQPQEKFLIG